MVYDKVIIGAGLYGLYSALYCGKRGQKVLVLEHDERPFMRASYNNQARVHMGYHYPRSISTALKSRKYFNQFNADFGFCIHDQFAKVYGISANFSWSNAAQFEKFCRDAGIYCEAISPTKYFKDGLCEGAFLTTEYTYDALTLRDYFVTELASLANVEIKYLARISHIEKRGRHYEIVCNHERFKTEFVLNVTFSGVNQIHHLLGLAPFQLKYELCEVILCQASEQLRDVGITIMDGPFASIMPFGQTGYHSLTSVTVTPHMTSKNDFPVFSCQEDSGGYCSAELLGNCNQCAARPVTAFPYMSLLARKYLREEYDFTYIDSLFSIKPILRASEIDDSRPTVIKQFSSNPTFISVLSGKINTVYDLDEVLADGYE